MSKLHPLPISVGAFTALLSLGGLSFAANAESAIDSTAVIDLGPDDPGDDISAAQTADTVLDNIIVTAQKIEQDQLDVPRSIQALDGASLASAGIENLFDLTDYTPNFRALEASLQPSYFVRGNGSGTNAGFEQSVGVFVDGIHYGRSQQTRGALMDVDRIEVLRGPQSILFGKNAIAGALNIISATPIDAFQTELAVDWGLEFQQREIDGMVNVPLGAGFASRLSARHRDDEGFLFNREHERREPAIDENNLRAQLAWDDGGATRVNLKLSHTDRSQSGRTWQLVEHGRVSAETDERAAQDAVRETTPPEEQDFNNNALTLQIDHDWNGRLISLISGVSQYEIDDVMDVDFSQADLVTIFTDEAYRQFSQEVRLSTDLNDSASLIAGAYYQQAVLDNDEIGRVRVRAGSVQDVPEGTAMTEIAAADMDRAFDVDSRSWALFAQGRWSATARLSLVAGLRYASENKTGTRVFNLYEVGTQTPLNPATRAVFSNVNASDHELRDTFSSGVWLPHANLEYRLSPGTLLFTSYTRGAKSGGFDARTSNADDGPRGGATNFRFDDELVDSWEVGLKSRFLNGKAELSAVAFYNDYRNQQVSLFDGGVNFLVVNAASSVQQGIELDARWRPTPALLLSASVVKLDFEWQEFSNAQCHPFEEPNDEGFCDFAGRTYNHIPPWSASLGIQWRLELGSWDLVSKLDIHHQDAYFTAYTLDPRSKRPAVTKFNAGLHLTHGPWAIGLAGRNLSNEVVQLFSGPSSLNPDGFAVMLDRTREVSLRLAYRY